MTDATKPRPQFIVTPAQAGIQRSKPSGRSWAPAFAGATKVLCGGRIAHGAALVVIGLLAGCAPKPPPPPHLELTRVSFADLPGWRDGDEAAALPALLKSCGALAKLPDDARLGVAGLAGDWRRPCTDAAALTNPTADTARNFFETESAPFAVPILARPLDLVSADLGAFRPAWRGERISGCVVGSALVPYWTRAQIEAGALNRFHLALLYAADPIDLFFLQVQGSGRVRLADGRTVEIGYARENGRAYVALGKLLVERGAMTLDQVSLQSIKAWLRAHPDDAKTLMDDNPSYVFFRVLPGGAPIGAEGVELTPGRSLAVDPRFVPLGVPLWLDVAQGDSAIRRLVVAQDTGGAISGPLRGDLFWGAGETAEARAEPLRAVGRTFLLLPKLAASKG